jgi:hypothetical protein
MTYINPTIAVKSGLFCSGTLCVTITKAPVRMPALPQPATALPTIKTKDVGARAQIKLPIANTMMAAKNDQRILNLVYTRPYNGWKAQAVRR